MKKNGILKKINTIIYAGNIGRFQGLETAVYAMSLINKIKDIELPCIISYIKIVLLN